MGLRRPASKADAVSGERGPGDRAASDFAVNSSGIADEGIVRNWLPLAAIAVVLLRNCTPLMVVVAGRPGSLAGLLYSIPVLQFAIARS